MEDRLALGVKPGPTGEEKAFERGGSLVGFEKQLKEEEDGERAWREGENVNETTDKNLGIKIAYAV